MKNPIKIDGIKIKVKKYINSISLYLKAIQPDIIT
jgi:hypothetical protein